MENEARSNEQTDKKWVWKIIALFAVTGGLAVGIFYFLYSLSHESTDDAYITGTIVPVAPEISGRVTHVYITDNQYVLADAPLLEIFSQDYADEAKEKSQVVSGLISEKAELEASLVQRQKILAQAQANLSAATAQAVLAQKDFVRYRRLADEDAIPRNRYDQIESAFKVACAQKEAAAYAVDEVREAIRAIQAKLAGQDFKIKSAEARQRLTELNLNRTRLLAPVSGRIAKKMLIRGNMFSLGKPFWPSSNPILGWLPTTKRRR